MRHLTLDPARAAHAAACIASLNKRPVKADELLRILRSADKESMTRHGEPITYTKRFAKTLGRLGGPEQITIPYDRALEALSQQKEWQGLLLLSNDGMVSLRQRIDEPGEVLEELSEADVEVLRLCWEKQQALMPPTFAMR